MKKARRSFALATVLSLCAGPPQALAQGAAAPLAVDLSESGQAFALATRATGEPSVPWEIAVALLPDAAWDRLDLEVRGARAGEALRFVVSGASGALRPATSVGVVDGGFRWSAHEALPAPGGAQSFELRAPRARFLVRLAGPSGGATEAPYYGWERYLGYMSQVQAEPLAQVTSVGSSIQGRPLLRVVVDAPSSEPKRTVLMGVRQHGDEYGSSYLLEGALDLLLGRNGLTPEPELLEKVRWIIYPLMNPDGAVNNVRYNANGVDLNRDWQRTGASALTQEPETFALQSDVEDFQALYGFAIGGDHHGWGSSPDGGYRYALGQSVSFVSEPEYQEARKDTQVITLHDPTQTNWQENGGVNGMLRSELFLRHGFLIHTPEYNSAASSEAQFHAKGQAWVRAMLDTLFAPRFTDAEGFPDPFALLPADTLFVTVDDLDENLAPGVAESVVVTLTDAATGDAETLELVETGPDTGLFRNPTALVVLRSAPTPGNGTLESVPGSTLTASYVDDDFPGDASTASLPVLPTRAFVRLEPTRRP